MELAAAPRLVFPGVGAFGAAMRVLTDRGYVQPLRDYVQVCASWRLARTRPQQRVWV